MCARSPGWVACQPISGAGVPFDMLRNSVLNSLLLFAKVIPAAVGSAFWVTLARVHFSMVQFLRRKPHPPTFAVIVLGDAGWSGEVFAKYFGLWPGEHLFSNLSKIYFVTKAANDGF